MTSIVLLCSYVGCSDYRFWWECDGRKLEMDEVRALGYWNDDLAREHKRSSYVFEWFEVVPGTRITLEVDDDYQETLIEEKRTFIIGETLPEPEFLNRSGGIRPASSEYLTVYATEVIVEDLYPPD